MTRSRAAALLYAAVSVGVVAFQIALALGAPWGAYAMSGAFPGRLPPAMRVAAVAQALLIVLLVGVVLARSGLALARWSDASRSLIWIAVGTAAVAVALNVATRSAGERALWAPAAVVLLASSLSVATATRAAR